MKCEIKMKESEFMQLSLEVNQYKVTLSSYDNNLSVRQTDNLKMVKVPEKSHGKF